MIVLVAAGGTGGHIFPALAVADILIKRHPEIRPIWIGSSDRMEATLIPSKGIEFHGLKSTGFKRKPTPGNFAYNIRSLWFLAAAIFSSIGIIRKLRPRFVLTTGGFAAGAAGLAAWMTGTPIAIIEPNVYPGMTNRFLGKHAKLIFTAYENARSHFPTGRVYVTGSPARREVVEKDRVEARKSLRLSDDALMILAMGGSQGAATINKILPEAVTKIIAGGKPGNIVVIHQCGKGKLESVKIDCDKVPQAVYRIMEFIDDAPTYLAAADIIVCRAGASTLSEIGCRGIPSIMIPLPISAENHQLKNARAWESAGASICIEEKDLTPEILSEKIGTLLSNHDIRAEMGKAASKLSDPSAADRIVDLIEEKFLK